MPLNFKNTLISAFYLIVDNHLVNVLQSRNSLCRSIRLWVLDRVGPDAQVVGRTLARANLSSGHLNHITWEIHWDGTGASVIKDQDNNHLHLIPRVRSVPVRRRDFGSFKIQPHHEVTRTRVVLYEFLVRLRPQWRPTMWIWFPAKCQGFSRSSP